MAAVIRQVLPQLSGSIVALGLLFSAGCEESRVCTSSLVPSVTLTIMDGESGEPVPDPVITFQVDGGELRMPEQLNPGEPGDRIALAYEETGLFEITVGADGYESMDLEYEIEADGCHPITVDETVELVPVSP